VKFLPTSFEARMGNLLGEELPLFIHSLQTNPTTSIRWNPKKVVDPAIEQPITWTSFGSILVERPKFNLDPLWHAGAYYVQESSSMFLEQFVKRMTLPETAIALDACAAPGGKSTHLLSLLPDDAVLICNEVISKRNAILQENLVKWGHSNYIVTQNDIQQFESLPHFFDVVVIDAPCSGEGLFRKDKAAIQDWSDEHVKTCAVRQAKLLESLLETVKINGYLIYSTCTFSEAENEDNIRPLLDSGDWELVQIDITNFAEITLGKDKIGYRFYPHKIMGEGFYIAGLKRIRANHSKLQNSKEKTKYKKTKSMDLQLVDTGTLSIIQPWLKENIFPHIGFQFNEWIVLFPTNHQATLNIIWAHLNVTRIGVLAGKIMHQQLIPEHPLAISQLMNNTFATIDADLTMALLFLQKKTFEVPSESALGWNLIQYKGVHLGWIKVLGNRINNYYPKNWSIQNFNG
jgi:16S rRNA C967 or C1407 C5-methylase (RsmB/RsmF family)/NOL1/NOP2/fmu family ribosome biogenesis protein